MAPLVERDPAGKQLHAVDGDGSSAATHLDASYPFALGTPLLVLFEASWCRQKIVQDTQPHPIGNQPTFPRFTDPDTSHSLQGEVVDTTARSKVRLGVGWWLTHHRSTCTGFDSIDASYLLCCKGEAQHKTASFRQGQEGGADTIGRRVPAMNDATHGQVTHVLFDMDGLLLNTEDFYTVALQGVLSNYGKDFTFEHKAKMMGMRAVEATELLLREVGLTGQITAEEFLELRDETLNKLFPTASLMPGAEKLVRHLHQSNIPIAVATSSKKIYYDLKTTNHQDFFSLFQHVVTGDMVNEGKPQPDIFLKAASLFETQPNPETVLVFEDAPAGVQAARAAGMKVVMVPDERMDKDMQTADVVLKSLTEFNPTMFGLPNFI